MLPCSHNGGREELSLGVRNWEASPENAVCFHNKELSSGREEGSLIPDGGRSGFKGIGIKREMSWYWRVLSDSLVRRKKPLVGFQAKA